LNEIGYHIKYEILNTSKITDIPQNRERIYIVCFKDKVLYEQFEFNFEEKTNKQIKDFLVKNNLRVKIKDTTKTNNEPFYFGDETTLTAEERLAKQNDFLKKTGCLDKIGGTKVLLELLNQIPNLVYLEEYIQLIQDKFLRRSLIHLGYETQRVVLQ
jgi:site-specific DNA-cytosine methylase